MFANSKKATVLLAVGAAFAIPAIAEMSAADIVKLGTTLTPALAGLDHLFESLTADR